MSFEAKGQELFAKFTAATALVLFYVAVILGAMYLVHWFGPESQRVCKCECPAMEVK